VTATGDAVEVRRATADDAPALAALLADLGYPADATDVPERLERLRGSGDDAFVALVDASIVGLATVHSRVVLHTARPVAQLTALVVSPTARGHGVGRALVGLAERWALERGAERLVVTTALHRAEAPVFYERLGFAHTGRRYVKQLIALLALALLALPARVSAQVRESPVPFDSAGRILAITPPLAARLGLAPPAWPVSGDYVDARLYVSDDTSGAAVLVVRRQREVLDRYALARAQRLELAASVDRGVAAQRAAGGPDSLATRISDPVRGWFVANQTALGVVLFGPFAAVVAGNAAGGTAAYLAVAGGTFFIAADRAQRSPVSNASNHLAWHGARQGAAAAGLAAAVLGGDDLADRSVAGAVLLGGVLGDIAGYQAARPMTDAEAHGVSHGGFAGSALAFGATSAAGMWRSENGSRRAAAALVLGAGAIGYPLGFRYARTRAYRVTAGDVGTLVAGEMLGMSAVATLLPSRLDDNTVSGFIAGGFALGAIVADRLIVRPFDYGEAESRLLQLGTAAGAVVGLAIPVLVGADNPQVVFGPATAGGILGAILTHELISPARARNAAAMRTGARRGAERLTLRFTPQNLLLARSGQRGVYPVLSASF
jgi:GNAT superfamily N-acetyltransferase